MTVSLNLSANVNLRLFAYLIYLPRLIPLITTFFSFVCLTGLVFLILPISGLGLTSLLVPSLCLSLILHLVLLDFFMVFLKARCLVLCCSPSTPLLSLILLPLTHLYLTICMLMTLSFLLPFQPLIPPLVSLPLSLLFPLFLPGCPLIFLL